MFSIWIFRIIAVPIIIEEWGSVIKTYKKKEGATRSSSNAGLRRPHSTYSPTAERHRRHRWCRRRHRATARPRFRLTVNVLRVRPTTTCSFIVYLIQRSRYHGNRRRNRRCLFVLRSIICFNNSPDSIFLLNSSLFSSVFYCKFSLVFFFLIWLFSRVGFFRVRFYIR